jgi:hypothetical protein
MINVKMDRRKVDWGCMDWIHVAEVKDPWRDLSNMVMNLRYFKLFEKLAAQSSDFDSFVAQRVFMLPPASDTFTALAPAHHRYTLG